MKRSNIIFIVFLISVVVFVGFITHKFFYANEAEYRAKQEEDFQEYTFDVPDFNVLVVEQGANVWLRSSTGTPFFKVKVHKDSSVVEPGYVLLGDTLKVLSTEALFVQGINLHVPAITHAMVKGDMTVVLPQDHYSFSVSGGRLNLNGHAIKHLKLEVKGGKVYSKLTHLLSFKADIAAGDVNLYRCKMNEAVIHVSDSSRVRMGQALKLDLEKDELSKVIVK